MASEPLTCLDLEEIKCSTPGCTCDDSKLFVEPKCHPKHGVEAAYVRATGVLEVYCKTCRTHIVDLKIAEF